MSMRALATAFVTLIAGTFLGGQLPAAAPWAETLTQQALNSGFLTRLPAPVSVAFGLAKAEEGTEVRQLLSKSGHRVRTFNVSVANHADVVVFNINAQTGATLAYLVTPDGRLRKAVSYQAGGAAEALAAADAQAGLAREGHFWSARARQGSAPSAQ
jgi:hypothetical protein